MDEGFRGLIRPGSHLTMKCFSVIGAGNLGNHLIAALVKKGYILKHIYKKSKSRQFEVALSHDLEQVTAEADFVIISTQESRIRAAAEAVAASAHPAGKIVFHTANALTSTELRCLAEKGAYTASFSPLQTFPEYSPDTAEDVFKGIYFLAEGHPDALALARQIAKDLDANLLTVEETEKIYFHIAGVAASNFLIAILKLAENQLKKTSAAGSRAPLDIKILLPLIKQTLKNVESRGVEASLTGPAKRKEAGIIQKHLEALSGDEAVLYRVLSDFLRAL